MAVSRDVTRSSPGIFKNDDGWSAMLKEVLKKCSEWTMLEEGMLGDFVYKKLKQTQSIQG